MALFDASRPYQRDVANLENVQKEYENNDFRKFLQE